MELVGYVRTMDIFVIFLNIIIVVVCDREIFKPPILIRSGGGIYNYLYALQMSPPPTKSEASNVLGKLQITWRTNLGEPGRLQTQQITGNVTQPSFYY